LRRRRINPVVLLVVIVLLVLLVVIVVVVVVVVVHRCTVFASPPPRRRTGLADAATHPRIGVLSSVVIKALERGAPKTRSARGAHATLIPRDLACVALRPRRRRDRLRARRRRAWRVVVWREDASKRRAKPVTDGAGEVLFLQKFFTHRLVSTLDRIPFQLTGELFLYGMALSCAVTAVSAAGAGARDES
jgi:hypothetical protein